MFHWIFPSRFLMEIKILLISAQFCLIYFHFLKTHLSWNVYNLNYDLNFLVFLVWFGFPSWKYIRPEVSELPGTEKVGWKIWPSVLSTLSPPRSSMSSAERPVSMPRTSTSNLNVHKQSKHAAIKSDCDQCECKATQKGNLKLHKLLIHKGSKFDCDNCDYK